MSEANEKRVVIRVEPGEWQRMDDKRHAERTSFQDVGLKLFRHWLDSGLSNRENPGHNAQLGVKLSNVGTGNLSISEAEVPWVQCLVNILRSGNAIAGRAISSNLLTFADYIKAVPEVPGGLADLAAQAERLAALDRRILEQIKTAPVGSPAAAPPARRNNAPRSRRS